MTFQSTSENASVSVITPIHTIATTPSSAATVLSTTFAITMTIVMAKIAMAIHSIMGFGAFARDRRRPVAGADAGHLTGWTVARARWNAVAAAVAPRGRVAIFPPSAPFYGDIDEWKTPQQDSGRYLTT